MHVGTISSGDIAKGWKWDGSNLIVKGDVYITNGDIAGTPASYVHGWQYGSTTYIDGGDIYAGTVTTTKLTAHGTNLLGNPGFETGTAADWVLYQGSPFIYGYSAHTGTYCLGATGNGTSTVYPAFQRVLVIGGANYYLSVYAKLHTATSGTIGAFCHWYTADNTYISTTWFFGAGTYGSYIHYYAAATAPTNAAFGDLYLYIGSDVNGQVLFDDCEFYRTDGQVLVGAPGSARVEINSNGIEGYNSSNTKQFYIRSSDGRGAFGPAAKPCILDSTGIMLYGNETTPQDWTAIRWLTSPPTGTEVARLESGLFYTSAPEARLISNPGQSYLYADATIQAYGAAPDRYAIVQAFAYGDSFVSATRYVHYGSHEASDDFQLASDGTATWTCHAKGYITNGLEVSSSLTANGGLNVGSATGAGTGQVKASGNSSPFVGLTNSSTSYATIELGRTATEAHWAVAASAGQFAANAAAGDAILRVDSSSQKLHLLAGTGNAVITVTSSAVGIGTTGPSYQLQLSTDSAAKPSTNTWTIASDARLKRDVVPFTDGLAVLRQVNPIRYTYNGLAGMPESEGIGVIGQEIEKVAPYTARRFKARLKPDDAEETELVGFNSHALTFVLINAVKELDSRLSAIERGRN